MPPSSPPEPTAATALPRAPARWSTAPPGMRRSGADLPRRARLRKSTQPACLARWACSSLRATPARTPAISSSCGECDRLSRMKQFAFALALLLAAPTLAQRYPSRSSDDFSSDSSNLEGIYAAAGGGGQLMIFGGDNAFGYDAEARIGYSFNPAMQLYVGGSLDGARFV